MKTIIILVSLVLSLSLNAQRMKTEAEYQTAFAKITKGEINYQVKDVTIDILADIFVIEIEYADKYTEAIGNVLYKSVRVDKLPLILLIIETDEDLIYLEKLLYVAYKYKIKVWGINSNFVIKEAVFKE